VTNYDSNTVSVIDSTTNEVLPINITVGGYPSIAVNPNNDLVYVTNYDSNTVSVIDSTTNEVLPINIAVGDSPNGIAVNPNNDLVYVTNTESDTVSVINSTTNKVVTNNITVGDSPSGIAVNPNNYLVYVATSDDTVSVIDGTTNEVLPNNITFGDFPDSIAVNPNNDLVYVTTSDDTISVIDPYFCNRFDESCNPQAEEALGSVYTDITVGDYPESIAVNPNNDLVYVTNEESDTVSVIDGITNEVLPTNITVGDSPSGIAVNPNNNLVYVANFESDTVSVIDSKTDDIVVRASFNIKPVDSGQIICNDKKIPTNEYNTIKFDSVCETIPNSGFAFSSWVKRDLESNSSTTITESTPNPNPLLSLFFPNPNANVLSTFNITSSGHYVANFRDAPPPVPDGIWIALFSILLGTFMPSLIRWINGWKQRRRFYKYKEELPSKYENKSKYKNREAIDDEITELYAKGKINETQQKMLKDKIAEHYDQRSETGSTSTGI
jgi:YVTN family beta-propeller protein